MSERQNDDKNDEVSTPRTDEAVRDIGYYWPTDLPEKLTINPHDGGGEVEAVRAEFARQLERELNERNEQVAHWMREAQAARSATRPSKQCPHCGRPTDKTVADACGEDPCPLRAQSPAQDACALLLRIQALNASGKIIVDDEAYSVITDIAEFLK